MGLFSFLKKAGANLSNKEEKAAEAAEALDAKKVALLKDVLQGLNLDVTDLTLNVEDDKVIIGGKVDDQSTKEKVILALGNTAGIATVEDNLEVLNPTPEAKFYEVKSGDSLSKIAKEFYGDAMKYPAIFEANKPMLQDPNLIYPGQVLRIPPVTE